MLQSLVLDRVLLIRAVARHGEQVVDVAEDLHLLIKQDRWNIRVLPTCAQQHDAAVYTVSIVPCEEDLSSSSQRSCHTSASSRREIHRSGSWRGNETQNNLL